MRELAAATRSRASALLNYWGYSTLGFFAPKAGYRRHRARCGMQVDEFKTLVKELHRNGIEVILDVVFNHTAEGDERGPTISFRGLDNRTYYMLDAGGLLPQLQRLRQHAQLQPSGRARLRPRLPAPLGREYHVDGFRFDLASILGRDQTGAAAAEPAAARGAGADPVLGRRKLIAEAWDAGGLYQVGSFPGLRPLGRVERPLPRLPCAAS